jgi:hypothetical protein
MCENTTTAVYEDPDFIACMLSTSSDGASHTGERLDSMPSSDHSSALATVAYSEVSAPHASGYVESVDVYRTDHTQRQKAEEGIRDGYSNPAGVYSDVYGDRVEGYSTAAFNTAYESGDDHVRAPVPYDPTLDRVDDQQALLRRREEVKQTGVETQKLKEDMSQFDWNGRFQALNEVESRSAW